MTPASNPASKRFISSLSSPPIKPTLFVSVVKAATTPTKNEPSCSLNFTEVTFGKSTNSSIIAKLLSGFAWAAFSIADINGLPTAKVMS